MPAMRRGVADAIKEPNTMKSKIKVIGIARDSDLAKSFLVTSFAECAKIPKPVA
jgi:hypothetical protein